LMLSTLTFQVCATVRGASMPCRSICAWTELEQPPRAVELSLSPAS
jgi:hypothetical protein